MARTTVGDCLKHTPNHFELLMGVVSRAKALDLGAPSDIPTENDRSIVLALREIAAGKYVVDLEGELRKSLAEFEDSDKEQAPSSPDSTPMGEPGSAD